jgi:uncharacterized protein (TIGR02246 family)
MRTFPLTVFAVAALLGTCLAQSPTPAPLAASEEPPEKAIILASDRAFEQAYAKADAKALAAFFTSDADYTTDEGQSFRGQAAIQEAITASLSANKGAKLAINSESVRLLAPEVLLEKGSTSVTSKSGEVNSDLYTAIYLKKEGKWKISQLIESPQPSATPHERLSELEWLVGGWEEADKNDNLTIRSQYVWARGGNFLTRNITVKREGETALEGWQIIGWDPAAEKIHSWTFDGAGGFSDGTWTREGQRWLLRETGVTPEGNRTTADSTLTKLSPDRIAWESTNRTLNGDPQPGIGRIEVNRLKGH